MRGNEFLEKLELADPAFVAEADPGQEGVQVVPGLVGWDGTPRLPIGVVLALLGGLDVPPPWWS